MELIHLLEGHSRLRIPVEIYSSAGLMEEVDCLIDTGCSTTMVDMDLAKRCGLKLEETSVINLGNQRYLAQAYKLEKLLIGSLEIKDVFVLAVEYDISNELRSGMLLGLNVLNNLEYCVNRNHNVIRIKENIFANVPDKSYPYMHWFRGKGSDYVKFQGKTM